MSKCSCENRRRENEREEDILRFPGTKHENRISSFQDWAASRSEINFMKFTVEQKALLKMLKLVGKKMPYAKRSDPVVRLSACAARVFVEANESVAGVEALVFEDGTCTVPREHFTDLIKSYRHKRNLTIEANERVIEVASSQRSVLSYSAKVKPPARLQVFPVTDTWVAASQSPPSAA